MSLFKWLFGKRHVCDSERYININGCLDPNCPHPKKRNPLPKIPPKAPPPAPKGN